MAPRWYEVVIGCLATLGGCVGAAVAFSSPGRGGSRLSHICGIGAVIFVAGVAGQRSFAGPGSPGPWEAGVALPLIGLRLTPVAVCGILMVLLGLSLVLFLESPPAGARPGPSRRWADFENDDSA